MSKTNLMQGDCLERMKEIPDGSVDMVLTDPPYGTTACKWDSIIPLEPMWEQLKRVIKPNGAIVMTASQPFTTTIIASNTGMFKYEWIWEKSNGTNFLNTKFQPFKVHENVLVFGSMATSYSKKGTLSYNPQKTKGEPYELTRGKGKMKFHQDPCKQPASKNNGDRMPRSVQRVNEERGLHPTQKPVALMEYLIKTYANEGETVLDFTMGSGTTGVACVNLGRDFIGIEMDDDYFRIASDRIEKAQTVEVPPQMDLFVPSSEKLKAATNGDSE